MRDLKFEQRWLVVDVATDADLDQWDGVHQVCDPVRAGTYMRIGDARYRWEFRLLPGETAEDYDSLAALKPLIAPWTSRAADDELELIRVTEYTFRAQMADSWRRDNVFLLGDAAHLTPPFIGQGMGAGLRDAMNLAWKLAGVLTGDLPPHGLGQLRAGAKTTRPLDDPAGAERRTVDDRRRRVRQSAPPRRRPADAPASPACATRSSTAGPRRCTARRSMHRSRVRRQLAGTLCPNPVLSDGAATRRGARQTGFALISAVPPDAAQRARLEQRGVALHIAEAGSDSATWLRRGHATAAIIRPDRTVMRAGRHVDGTVRCRAGFHGARGLDAVGADHLHHQAQGVPLDRRGGAVTGARRYRPGGLAEPGKQRECVGSFDARRGHCHRDRCKCRGRPRSTGPRPLARTANRART